MSFFKRLKDKFSGQDIEKDFGKMDDFESERKNEGHEEVEWRDENQDFERQVETRPSQTENTHMQTHPTQSETSNLNEPSPKKKS
ncbi:hypothetical protein SAGN_01235 [Staphylococcus agnetis]|nr:hypothetical protein [Staphylococcus agnetis]KFE42894.1 hypothetical protein SAGN_01235 [Staphylococcus agnetis]